MQLGDVYQTNADTTHLETEVIYHSRFQFHEGIMNFIQWYKKEYYGFKK